MSSDGEKVRTSGEVVREQTLPTVNPAAEKQEPPKAAFHPAIYVRWVSYLEIMERWTPHQNSRLIS